MENNYQDSEDFFKLLSRLERAAPPPMVWDGIIAQVNTPVAKQVSMISWRKVAAAAAIVLALNTAGIFYALQNTSSTITASNYETEDSLVADFQLYE